MMFALTLFLSALLLFLVQPLAGKYLLPEFGGSAMVWNTSMVFFQAVLLLGYLYAHLSHKLLGPRRQAALHLVLHLIALAWIPFHLSVPEASAPWLQVVGALGVGLGVPFFIVSSNAPTLQRWYGATGRPDAANPYRLYAASNAGSLVALLAYPIAVEPYLGLQDQTRAWGAAFVALILGLLMCARALRTAPAEPLEHAPIPDWRQRLGWLGWAAVPSSLLLGTTTFLTSDVAALPLLWVLPLAAYLATFVVAFADRRWISTQNLHFAAIAALLLVAGQFTAGAYSNVWLGIPIHLLTLFIVGLAFHQSLVDRRPPRQHLTEFYVWMSLGGVLGGAFNALVAPELFDRAFEYPLVLAVALAVSGTQVTRLTPNRRALGTTVAVIGIILAGLWALGAFSNSSTTYAILVALAGSAPVLMWFRAPMIAAHAVAIALVIVTWRPFEPNLLERMRSPYGIYRVAQKSTPLGPQNLLLHGRINHGTQMRDPALQRLPSTYYSLRSPIGQVFDVIRSVGDTRPVGVVGLGVGTLATYSQPNQTMDFFEIDPLIVDLAKQQEKFSYLALADGTVHTHVGDGRKLIEARPARTYSLLVLDAYSSDAVPVHLLTVEAMRIYMDRTTDDGWLLFHVTNGFIDVGQIVANAASSLGWTAIEQKHWPRESQDVEIGATTSEWVAVARTPEHLAPLQNSKRWTPLLPDDRPVWTDDYANIFPYWQ